MEQTTIHIKEVLKRINTVPKGQEQHIFSIKFIRKTGEKAGTAKLVEQATKKGKFNNPARKLTGTASSKYRIKENKLLLLYDLDKEQHFSCPIETIIQFNGSNILR